MPTSCGTYSEALRVGREVFEEVKVALVERAEEDEILESGAGGAWAPEIEDYQEALTLLAAAVEKVCVCVPSSPCGEVWWAMIVTTLLWEGGLRLGTQTK